MSLKESLLRVAALDAIIKRLKDADKDARVEATEAMKAAHKETGAKSFDITLPDGRKVGGMQLKGSTGGFVVKDREALVAWARTAHPNEVSAYQPPVEYRLNPEFEKTLLANAKAVEGGIILPDGEVLPGVEYEAPGEPNTLSIASSPKLDRPAILEAFTQGALEHVVPLALPKGGAA